jgi:hypothetical protein
MLSKLSLAAIPPQRMAIFRALQVGNLLCPVPAFRALHVAFPRALGACFILALPLQELMQARLNEIKDREDFQPVAPVVLKEEAAQWFTHAVVSPCMLFVYDVQWSYYRIVTTLLTGIAGAIAGNVGLAVGAIGVWLALTARFYMQRLQHTSRRLSHIAEMVVTSALHPLLSVFWRVRGALQFRVFFL